MGDYENEPVIAEADFEPDADVFNIWVSKKPRWVTRGGERVREYYHEACWDIPLVARAADDARKRPQITASHLTSPEIAERACREKIMLFWLERSKGVRHEVIHKEPSRMSIEQRSAGYTVQSFLDEWAASKSNPNTAPQNRWKANTERNNRTMLTKWIYPYWAIPS